MHWAVDRYGEVVAATDFVVYSAPFTCPACGEPVYHRRGSERRAHFAHYHMGSDWFCENYSPNSSLGSPEGSVSPRLARARSIALQASPGASATLCIEHAETRHANLLLRLPASWTISNATSITIRSSLGQQQILSKEMDRRKFVRLPWSVPVGVCEVSGDQEGVEVEINEALKNLRHNGNFFASVLDRGALLDESEELEVGKTYWLIAQRGPAAHDLPRSISLEKFEGPASGWQKFRLHLPDCERSVLEVAAIERFLGRRLRSSKACPRIVWPIPVRFAPDGVAVYGSDDGGLEIQWDGDGGLELERDGLSVDISSTTVPDRFLASDLNDGEYVIKADGLIKSSFRVEPTDPFRPVGVRVYTGQYSRELFEYDDLESLRASHPDIRVTVPSHRLWRTSKINGLKIREIPDNTESVLDFSTHEVDFGAFGLVPTPNVPLTATEIARKDVLTSKRASRASLQGLALRHAGAASARDILELNNSDDCQRWARRYGLQWMLPYVLRTVCKGWSE